MQLQQHQQTTDHISKFFQAMEETVRTFPSYLQVQTKSKISSMVLEMELEAIKHWESQRTVNQDNHLIPDQRILQGSYQEEQLLNVPTFTNQPFPNVRMGFPQPNPEQRDVHYTYEEDHQRKISPLTAEQSSRPTMGDADDSELTQL